MGQMPTARGCSGSLSFCAKALDTQRFPKGLTKGCQRFCSCFVYITVWVNEHVGVGGVCMIHGWTNVRGWWDSYEKLGGRTLGWFPIVLVFYLCLLISPAPALLLRTDELPEWPDAIGRMARGWDKRITG